MVGAKLLLCVWHIPAADGFPTVDKWSANAWSSREMLFTNQQHVSLTHIQVSEPDRLVTYKYITTVLQPSQYWSLSSPSKPRAPRLQWGPGHTWGHYQGSGSVKHFSGIAEVSWVNSLLPRGTEPKPRFSPLDLVLCRTAWRASVGPTRRDSSQSRWSQVSGTKCHNLEGATILR